MRREVRPVEPGEHAHGLLRRETPAPHDDVVLAHRFREHVLEALFYCLAIERHALSCDLERGHLQLL